VRLSDAGWCGLDGGWAGYKVMGIDKVSVIIYLMYLDKKDKNRFTVGK